MRDLLDSGTIRRYIDELSVTGLTSKAAACTLASKNSTAYDQASTLATARDLFALARRPHLFSRTWHHARPAAIAAAIL
jgi:hypothetical protein